MYPTGQQPQQQYPPQGAVPPQQPQYAGQPRQQPQQYQQQPQYQQQQYQPQPHVQPPVDPQQQQYQVPQQPQQGQPQQAQPTHQQQPIPQQQQQPSHQQPAAPSTAAPEVQSEPLVSFAPPNDVRFTWNAYPNSAKPGKTPAGHAGPHGADLPPNIVPLAAIYTPMSHSESVPVVRGQPPQCRTCGAIWSCHSQVDVQSKFWACSSCLSRNPLPADFDANHPALNSQAVDYVVPQPGTPVNPPPLFFYIIDTCISVEELDALKANLVRSLEWLPPNALVGCISFGRSVTVWEIGFGEMSKCFVLRGHRDYSEADLLSMLNVNGNNSVLERFLIPVSDCEFVISSILEELTPDPFPVPNGLRPERATGTALQLALTISQFARDPKVGGSPTAFTGGKMMLFIGGPCTRGPGSIATTDKGDIIRGHRDLMEGEAPLFEAAVEFYAKLNKRLSDAACCLDAMVASFDQVGILELRSCVNDTGGTFICCDKFDHKMFSESLRRHFQRCDLSLKEGVAPKAGFGALLNVYTSADTLICGAIGPVAGPPPTAPPQAAGTKGPSPVVIGRQGPTWGVSQVDTSTAVTVIFDTETGVTGAKHRFVQFVLHYESSNGEHHVRVTSVLQPVAANDHTAAQNQEAFDQECAAVVVAKIAVTTLELGPNKFDVVKRWLDRLLVRFVKRFGRYRVGDPESLQLSRCFSFFPGFLYNLRRSEYFMWLNISPDETAFKRHFLLHEFCNNALLMMQPTLMQYTMENPTATACQLDSSSITPDSILLMDAFFNVHIMWGQTIDAWRKANYQDLPEYAHFKVLLEAPEADVEQILEARFPYPRFSRTSVDGPEARHIKTRVNPSSTYNTGGAGGGGAYGQKANHQDPAKTTIYTDDASIGRFMQTLKAAVVSPDDK